MLYKKASSTLKVWPRNTDTRRTGLSKLLTRIKEATKARDLKRGKEIHAEAVENGDDSHTFVVSSLVNMYAKCGSLEDARKVFYKSTRHDVFSWTALLSGYADRGEAEVALDLFTQMRSSDCEPNGHTMVAVVKACSNMATKDVGKLLLEKGRVVKLAALEKGMEIHQQAVKSGCVDMFVANALVDMYGRCGSLWDARMVFDRMCYHDVVSWTSLIWAYAQNEEFEAALRVFFSMTATECIPNVRAFVVALKACAGLAVKEESKHATLETGRRIHDHARELQLDLDAAVQSCLIETYFNCGTFEEARRVFNDATNCDVGPWNAMLLGYAQNGEQEATFHVYKRMHTAGVAPNSQTFYALLKACANSLEEGDLKEVVKARGTEIHSAAEKYGFVTDKLVATSLIDLYSKCGEMREAQHIFDHLEQRDVVVWTSLILGYTQNSQPSLALEIYEQMLEKSDCLPDSQCFATALKACSHLATKDKVSRASALQKGLLIASQAAKAGCVSDEFVSATLVDMYSKCGDMINARHVFDKVHCPDVTSWTSIIAGYTQNGQAGLAVQEFYRMHLQGSLPVAQTFVAVLKACSNLAGKEEGKLVDGTSMKVLALKKTRSLHSQAAATGFDQDVYVTSTLVDLYSKCGSMADARGVCASTENNIVAWTALILGYVSNSNSEAALDAYAEMECRGCRSDAQVLAAVLKACSDVAAVKLGKDVHASVLKNGFENNPEVGNALIDLYGKSGMMPDAQHLFDSIPGNKSIETWTTLMGGYSRLGETDRVFRLFHGLDENGLKPDGITFTYVLAACSHAGLVRKGSDYFQRMTSRYGVKAELEHYHGMIDLFGRANRLQEALRVIKSMPLEPTTVTWMTLLSSCKKWNNVAVAKVAFESLRSINDRHAAAHVLMGNIYASQWYSS